MKFLGIKIGDHDANFAFSDGIKVFYHKSERALQIKHHGSTDPLVWIPILKTWGYEPSDIDAICVTSDEELYRETIDPTVHYHQITTEDWFPGMTCPVYRLDHHLAHALSIWPVTDVDPSVSFVFDGDGDFGRSFSIFKGLELIDSKTVREVQSFGQVLEDLAEKFEIQGQRLDVSGKLMGLKSYGTVNREYKNLISIFSLTDISKVIDLTFWETVTQTEFAKSKLEYLATIHDFAETKFPELFNKYATPDEIISFTGGVAQNSVINAKIQKDFPNCVIPPHAADDGLSLGCIELLRRLYYQERFSTAEFPFWQNDPMIEPPSPSTVKQVAEMIAAGQIIGWHQGQGEIGPRALGNRSILMDPRIVGGKDIINVKVKHRESFRPFGASVLEEHANKYFDIKYCSPYMLHVVDVLSTELPAVTHVDGTSRVQTVNQSNLHYHTLLTEFYKITQCPVLLNTSLNNNGKPIASTEGDSIEFFKNSSMDAICIGDRIYKK
jgi:carbamoyltransferase